LVVENKNKKIIIQSVFILSLSLSLSLFLSLSRLIGIFDMIACLLEGMLAMLVAASTAKRRHRSAMSEHVNALRWIARQLAFGEKLHVAVRCKALTKGGRLRDRLVALTDSHLWIVNASALADAHSSVFSDDDYVPKRVPVFLIASIEAPESPDTTFHVVTGRRVFRGRSRLSFLVPNRDQFLATFRMLGVQLVKTPTESVDALLHGEARPPPQSPSLRSSARRRSKTTATTATATAVAAAQSPSGATTSSSSSSATLRQRAPTTLQATTSSSAPRRNSAFVPINAPLVATSGSSDVELSPIVTPPILLHRPSPLRQSKQ
jgi:hypothetical protein